ncbi:autotransporter outer membrane beta-barrel domain-containing protein [Pontibacter qinzhouensis]|uniref:Autotransporter outer membrane beta-barrel domain-containing protein n=1 Tax=Pontibacter qinzhouensis TaxID=2603253 RepID=A0A5C8K6Y0_9BACT|nr:autotransporter outer membrane beta-barrel domain-containing protein [Pontibacter qinzhouensis]TXK47666.1 autotransporter outer membrane beta-barrel domain-containing protein [Pontibacter qinzhouensis]
MLKYTFTFLIAALPFLAQAQENRSSLYPAKVKQGSIMMGGNISGSFYKFNNGLNSNNGLYQQGTTIQALSQIKGGYFIIPDLVVGLELDHNYTSTATKTESGRQSNDRYTLLAGPFVRYYLDNGIFGEVTAGVGTQNLINNRSTNLYAGSVGIGYSHFISEKIAIEPLLSFRYLRETNTVNHNTRFGPMIGIGVQAYFLKETAKTIRQGL